MIYDLSTCEDKFADSVTLGTTRSGATADLLNEVDLFLSPTVLADVGPTTGILFAGTYVLSAPRAFDSKSLEPELDTLILFVSWTGG